MESSPCTRHPQRSVGWQHDDNDPAPKQADIDKTVTLARNQYQNNPSQTTDNPAKHRTIRSKARMHVHWLLTHCAVFKDRHTPHPNPQPPPPHGNQHHTAATSRLSGPTLPNHQPARQTRPPTPPRTTKGHQQGEGRTVSAVLAPVNLMTCCAWRPCSADIPVINPRGEPLGDRQQYAPRAGVS